jgi:TRAP transporter 4TM/12TM fusion protein
MATEDIAVRSPEEGRAGGEGTLVHKGLAVVTALFVGYSALQVGLNVYERLATFLLLSLVYVFIRFPLVDSFDREFETRGRRGLYGVDAALLVASLISVGYLVVNSRRVMRGAGAITGTEVWLGFVALFVVLEATRRTINLFIPVFTLCFVAYAYLGPLFPGVFSHPGFTTRQIMIQLYATTRGLFSFPLAVMFDYVFLFILFGALLEYSGGADFFLDLAKALLGRVTGGPAKLAVISSGFMGMLSGSSVANVLTSGAVTIPLMKNQGYDEEFAGGVESAASAGGQLMPPVMGAAVFIMVEITGIDYAYIIVHALIPALLYFVCIYLVVHFESVKSGLTGLSESMIPDRRSVALRAYYFIPFFLLVYLIMENLSIQRSIIYSVGALLALTSFSPNARLYDPRREGETATSNPLVNGIERTAYRAAPIVVAATSVGVVIGIVGMTGVGLKISSFILQVGGSNLLVVLLLTMVLSIVFGMAMDTVTVYVILAVIVAPILSNAGVPTFSAHLFIFYFGLMAMVTPPVCIAAYAAASLAEADPMGTGFWAWKIALTAFILPFAFVYNPELLLIGPAVDVAVAVVTATIGVIALAGAIVGNMYIRFNPVERAVLFGAAILFITGNGTLNLVGAALLTAGLFQHAQHFLENGVRPDIQ